MGLRIVRNPDYLVAIAPGLTDAHLWAAITPPRTWVAWIAPDEAHVMYAFEADERGWWDYGGRGE